MMLSNDIYQQPTMPEMSREMTDFISQRPQPVIRYGNTILFFILSGLLGLSFLVDYPDLLTTNLRIVAINAPKLIVSKTDGKLEKLLVANEEYVHNGEVLAFLQSTADHDKVIGLYHWLTSAEPMISNDNLAGILDQPLPVRENLGEVQAAYESFETIFKEARQTLAKGYYQEKTEALRKDIAQLTEMGKNIDRQRQLAISDIELQQKEYDAKNSLVSEKIIAPLEFNQEKSKLITKNQGLEQLNGQAINSKISMNAKEKEILDLKKTIEDQRQAFRSAFFTLKSSLQEWMTKYVVCATTDGKVNFVSSLQINEYIKNEQDLFYIVPSSNNFYGEIRATQSGSGKIRKGQKVIIRVNSYPSQEFGYLKGYVDYIPTAVGSDSTILIKVRFPDGLKTNYGKLLVFKSNMNGVAEIVTNSRKLPERLVGQLRELLTR